MTTFDEWVNNPKTWTVEKTGGVDMPGSATLKFTGDGTSASKGTLTVITSGPSIWSDDCEYDGATDSLSLSHMGAKYRISRDQADHHLKIFWVSAYGASWTAVEK